MHSISLLLLFVVVVDISYCTLQSYNSVGFDQPSSDPELQMEYKPKRNYDFVRFGRSARSNPSKKASYDYIRFGKRSIQEDFEPERYDLSRQL